MIKTRRKKTPTQDNLSGKRARFEKRPLILEKEEENGGEKGEKKKKGDESNPCRAMQ